MNAGILMESQQDTCVANILSPGGYQGDVRQQPSAPKNAGNM